MRVVGFFFFGELVEGIDGLAVVELAVTNVFGGAHDGDVQLAVTGADVIPVDEVDVRELAAVEDAVLDGHGLAAAEEYGTKMSVGVHAGVIARLVYIAAELRMDRAGMTVLMLLSEVRDHLAHDVQQIVLQVLQIEGIDVMRAFLDHDRAGGVMRSDADGTVLNAGLLYDFDRNRTGVRH